MNTSGLTPKTLVGAIDRVIKELEYPPLHPTLTGEDLIDLLKVSRVVLAGEFNLRDDDEDELARLKAKIESLLDDMDLAIWGIKQELKISDI